MGAIFFMPSYPWNIALILKSCAVLNSHNNYSAEQRPGAEALGILDPLKQRKQQQQPQKQQQQQQLQTSGQ